MENNQQKPGQGQRDPNRQGSQQQPGKQDPSRQGGQWKKPGEERGGNQGNR